MSGPDGLIEIMRFEKLAGGTVTHEMGYRAAGPGGDWEMEPERQENQMRLLPAKGDGNLYSEDICFCSSRLWIIYKFLWLCGPLA